jgi:hypothetical protein
MSTLHRKKIKGNNLKTVEQYRAGGKSLNNKRV